MENLIKLGQLILKMKHMHKWIVNNKIYNVHLKK